MTNKNGFTLIEVLIALAILGIAMTAILKTSTQNIRDTHYLQQKMIAHWVGHYVINEIRAGVLPIAKANTMSENMEMLGQNWTWNATRTETSNQAIQKITVSVSQNQTDDPLAELTSYYYVSAH